MKGFAPGPLVARGTVVIGHHGALVASVSVGRGPDEARHLARLFAGSPRLLDDGRRLLLHLTSLGLADHPPALAFAEAVLAAGLPPAPDVKKDGA